MPTHEDMTMQKSSQPPRNAGGHSSSVEAARAIEPLCILWCIPGFRQNEWTHAFKVLHSQAPDAPQRHRHPSGPSPLTRIMGSRIRVPLHPGHLPGLLSLSASKMNPQVLQRAGVTSM
jgi:hypothetical protein